MLKPSKGQDICDRTFAFAVRIVRLCRHLRQSPEVDPVLIKQLLRSGTSSGANVEEAQATQTGPDFVNKYAIALKEARETRYWLRILVVSESLQQARVADLMTEVEECIRIIGAIIVAAKKHHRRPNRSDKG